jgi:hypothetical protein
MFGDIKSEDEKLAFALELAFNEISKDKDEGRNEEEVLADNQTKDIRKKGHLGTNANIKLPFVIGTPEYNKHPYAGIVFLGNLGEDIEQTDLHKEEQK